MGALPCVLGSAFASNASVTRFAVGSPKASFPATNIPTDGSKQVQVILVYGDEYTPSVCAISAVGAMAGTKG
jgi:hypothetical protein